MTRQKETYFVAATLTEWIEAMNQPDRYMFVIAQTDDGESFVFTEYTPHEFMEFSTVPPFKIFFNVNLNGKTKQPKRRTAIRLTTEILKILAEVHDKIKRLANI